MHRQNLNPPVGQGVRLGEQAAERRGEVGGRIKAVEQGEERGGVLVLLGGGEGGGPAQGEPEPLHLPAERAALPLAAGGVKGSHDALRQLPGGQLCKGGASPGRAADGEIGRAILRMQQRAGERFEVTDGAPFAEARSRSTA
jgi:hypothetical protein